MNIKALSFIGICILEKLEFFPCEFSLIRQLKPQSEQFSSGQVVQDQSVAFKERERRDLQPEFRRVLVHGGGCGLDVAIMTVLTKLPKI